jgi:AsmA-like C-terminal region
VSYRKRRRHLGLALGIVGSVAAAFIVTGVIIVKRGSREISPHAREWVIDWLSAKFQSDVELADFHITMGERVKVDGGGLVLYFHGRHDVPPLITIKHFSVEANVLDIIRAPRHVSAVHLTGLEISIPPRAQPQQPPKASASAATPGSAINTSKAASIIVDAIDCDKTTLTIFPRDASKKPQVYDISQLKMHNKSANGAMSYHAVLSNPLPPGDIVDSGEFGPWQSLEPGATPVTGKFTYDNANLGVFTGVGGILSSKGEFTGILENLDVTGTTDTPDFVVTSGDQKVHLTTKYHAVVDGTNGDTLLQPVEATFRKTTLIARGGVVGIPGKPGKTITLDLTSTKARIEDLLALAVKGSPSMTGDVHLKTKFILPSGKIPLADKLFLDGTFEIDRAHFTQTAIQDKFDTLSNRSRGETDPEDLDQNVASKMGGTFRLKDGVITLGGLNFDVPGAHIQLAGTYRLDDESIDFAGELDTDAKLSQMTTGVKSFFLKAVDPFFEKKGHGAVLPIKITGTAQHPTYALDLHRKDSTKDKLPSKAAASSGSK